MAYTFVLTDLLGTAFGEVMNATQRQVVIPISKPASASFTITETNPQLANVLTRECLLKVYDGATLRFHGLVVATEGTPKDSGGMQVACTAADPAFRLGRRLSGQAASPAAITSDKADIAKQLIDVANSSAETGVQTITVTCGSTGTYIPGPYKYTLDCINELADSFDGFDWQITPSEYASGKIGTFAAASVLGGTQPDVFFEYGGIRANIRTFNAQRSWATLANRVYHIPDDGPSSPLGVVSASDVTSINARSLYETIEDASGIFDATLRAQLVQEVVGVRKDPRRVVTFTPDFQDDQRPGRVPVYGTDYNVGDVVRVRINPGGGGNPSTSALVDGYLRIYQMTIDIDANGKATYTPTTVDEGPATA